MTTDYERGFSTSQRKACQPVRIQNSRPALCVPRRRLPGCGSCIRLAPDSYAPWVDEVTIDGSALAAYDCPMWTPQHPKEIDE